MRGLSPLDILEPEERGLVPEDRDAMLRRTAISSTRRIFAPKTAVLFPWPSTRTFSSTAAARWSCRPSGMSPPTRQTELQVSRLNRELQRRVQELETLLDTAPIGLAYMEDLESGQIRGKPHERGASWCAAPAARYRRAWRRNLHPASFRVFRDGSEVPPDELPMQKGRPAGRDGQG